MYDTLNLLQLKFGEQITRCQTSLRIFLDIFDYFYFNFNKKILKQTYRKPIQKNRRMSFSLSVYIYNWLVDNCLLSPRPDEDFLLAACPLQPRTAQYRWSLPSGSRCCPCPPALTTSGSLLLTSNWWSTFIAFRIIFRLSQYISWRWYWCWWSS